MTAVLPSGRLREPLDAASSADCVLVPGSDDDVTRVAVTFDRMPVFRVTNHYEPLQPHRRDPCSVGHARRGGGRHRAAGALLRGAPRAGL